MIVGDELENRLDRTFPQPKLKSLYFLDCSIEDCLQL